jgi:hypothetical protein
VLGGFAACARPTPPKSPAPEGAGSGRGEDGLTGQRWVKLCDPMLSLLDRYGDQIAGVLSCWDRVVIQGTLPGLCFAEGMTKYLSAHDIRIFDYPRWAEPLRDQIRDNAERLAQQHGIAIEFVRKATFRKEERIKQVLAERGEHPGLVHILSAMEACSSYKPWHDKNTHRTFLKPDTGKCLHYYFYFIDEELGLTYVRVPTWAPFRLQVYFNGHNWLARKLAEAGIDYQLLDNAFVHIADLDAAQKLVEQLTAIKLHRALDRFAQRYCPVIRRLGVDYHWTLMQLEYATDIVFKKQRDLAPIYETLTRTAIHTVKPEHVATFLGRKLTGNYQDEMGNDFSTRIEGTRIRHHMGPASIKMYDKFGLVLRIETTANDVSFFKHHRKVEQRDGTASFKLAPVKKTIYSLADMRELMAAANRRYLDFLSALDDPSDGEHKLLKVCSTSIEQGRSYKGFNFFSADDAAVFHSLLRGEHYISGLRHADLREHLPDRSPSQISRLLKRLRVHGLLKRVGRTYKYYLTRLGLRVSVAGLAIKQLFLRPALADEP